MKLVALAAVAAGCTHPLITTSQAVLTPAESIVTIPHGLGEAQQLVIDKLGMRGFTLVERHVTAERANLRFVGNRDYTIYTIGSVFYATITPVSEAVSRVTLLGKPTIDHQESCPAVDGKPCVQLMVDRDWAVTGREEADIIRGVFAELQLEATLASAEARCGS